jgi:hypothetical protein
MKTLKPVKVKLLVVEVSKRQDFDFDNDGEKLIDFDVIKFRIIHKSGRPKTKVSYPRGRRITDGMHDFEMQTIKPDLAAMFPLGQECLMLIIPGGEYIPIK